VNVRLSAIGCVVAAAVAATSASAAVPPIKPIPVKPIPVSPGGPEMPATTATLSSTKVGAKPVALTVKVHYEMVCGQPGPGRAIVTLPAAADVPGRIDSSAVLVNGKPSPSVSVAGHTVSIAMPLKRPGVTCMVVGPGTLTLTLTRASGLGNPKRPGAYTIRVLRNTTSFRAKVKISA
jgi:hypothetical protein